MEEFKFSKKLIKSITSIKELVYIIGARKGQTILVNKNTFIRIMKSVYDASNKDADKTVKESKKELSKYNVVLDNRQRNNTIIVIR